MSGSGVPRWTLTVALGVCLAFLGGCSLLASSQRSTSPDGEIIDRPALLRMTTCSAGLPLAETLSESYLRSAPGLVIDIQRLDTGCVDDALCEGGEELLRQGAADLALVVRPYDPTSGLPTLREEDGDLHPVFLALDAVGVVVHDHNPLSGLSAEDLAALVAGYHPDWSALGGGDGQPVLVLPGQGSETRQLLAQRMMGELEVTPAARLAPDDRGILRVVREEERAVGLASRAWTQGRYGNGVKLVAIDEVMPGASTMHNGTYPLVYALVLLRSPDAPSDADAFIAYCVSTEARRLTQRHYVLPR